MSSTPPPEPPPSDYVKNEDAPAPQLKRVIGFWGITFYALGGIIGAGIFATIGAISGRAGAFAPFAFVIAGIPAVFAALSYGQLVKRLPRAGGEASYMHAAFGSLQLTRATALGVALSAIVSAATLLVAFGGYFQAVADVPGWAVSLGLAGVSVALAAAGVSLSSGVVVAVTVIELGLLALISVMGLGNIAAWPDVMATAPRPDHLTFGLASSAVLAFFAFVGFEDTVNMAEEVKDAERVLPRALIAAFAVSLVFYILVTATAVTVVPIDVLSASHEPLGEVVRAQGVLPAWLMTAMALSSIGNGVIIQVNLVSRLAYGLATDGGLPAVFARVSPRTNTPLLSVFATGGLILLFALLFPLEQLAELTGAVILVIFAGVQIALMTLLRREGKTLRRDWRAYIAPIAGCASALLLLIGAFV